MSVSKQNLNFQILVYIFVISMYTRLRFDRRMDGIVVLVDQNEMYYRLMFYFQ